MLSRRTAIRPNNIVEPGEAGQIGSDLPVAHMRAFGNPLIHEYRDIDARVVFDVARTNVPLSRAAAKLAFETDGR